MDRTQVAVVTAFLLIIINIFAFILIIFEKWFDRYLIRRKKAEICKAYKVDAKWLDDKRMEKEWQDYQEINEIKLDANWSKYEQQYREYIQKSK